MALTKISTGGVKDDAASQAKIADEAIDEARLQISNAGSNGQFLSKQSGDTGGLTWATPPDTNTQVGGATGVDFNDDVKARFVTGNDLEIYHSGGEDQIRGTGTKFEIRSPSLQLQATNAEKYLVGTENGSVDIYYDNSKKLETTSSGVTVTGAVSDSKGDLRSIPKLTKSSQHTLVASDAGKCIMVSSGGIVFPGSTMSSGDAVTIINNSGSDQTITCSAVSTYLAGDTTAKTSITIAGRGMATVWFSDGGTAYISGAGLS